MQETGTAIATLLESGTMGVIICVLIAFIYKKDNDHKAERAELTATFTTQLEQARTGRQEDLNRMFELIENNTKAMQELNILIGGDKYNE